MATNRSLVNEKNTLKAVLADLEAESRELQQVTDMFDRALDRYVRACGGDPERASEAEKTAFGNSMTAFGNSVADWLTLVIEAL